jgi:hypothetical protein
MRLNTPKLWKGNFVKGDKILLHDQRSTGYDIRDLRNVLTIIEHIKDEVYLNVYLDTRLEKILAQNMVQKTNVSIFTHNIVRHPISLEEIYKVAISQGAYYYARFDQLSSIAYPGSNEEVPKTGYLNVNPEDLQKHSLYLDSLIVHAKNSRSTFEHFIFVLFTWQKPYGSEFGGKKIKDRIIEGEKMSMSLENMVNVFSTTQDYLLKDKIALIPICVQYGDRNEIFNQVQYLNSSLTPKLPFSIYFPPIKLVDWSNNFYDQAVFLKAAASKGAILAGIGTTIQHLGLAVGGLFQIVAVNVEYSNKNQEIINGKGVDYWQSIEKFLSAKKSSNMQYPIVKVLKQLKPQDWKPVLESLRNELIHASRYISSL